MVGLFLSTYENRVDKKGRVSVPASFRTVLSAQNFQGIVAYSSFMHPCIEACSMERIEQLSESIDSLDPYSDERDAFAAAILGGSVQLSFDQDGRILLPDALLKSAQINDAAIFVGKGKTFEIWQPAQFHTYAAKAYDLAQQKRSNLRLSPKAPAKDGGAS